MSNPTVRIPLRSFTTTDTWSAEQVPPVCDMKTSPEAGVVSAAVKVMSVQGTAEDSPPPLLQLHDSREIRSPSKTPARPAALLAPCVIMSPLPTGQRTADQRQGQTASCRPKYVEKIATSPPSTVPSPSRSAAAL